MGKAARHLTAKNDICAKNGIARCGFSFANRPVLAARKPVSPVNPSNPHGIGGIPIAAALALSLQMIDLRFPSLDAGLISPEGIGDPKPIRPARAFIPKIARLLFSQCHHLIRYRSIAMVTVAPLGGKSHNVIGWGRQMGESHGNTPDSFGQLIASASWRKPKARAQIWPREMGLDASDKSFHRVNQCFKSI
jgi:hypothetical protein